MGDRFAPCESCERTISTALSMCPFCGARREPTPVETAPTRVSPSPVTTTRSTQRSSWWSIGLLVVGLALAGFVVVQLIATSEAEELCAAAEAGEAAPELLLLEAWLAADSRDAGDELVEATTLECPEATGGAAVRTLVVGGPEIAVVAGDGAISGEISRAVEMLELAEGMLGLTLGERLTSLSLVIDTDREILSTELGVGDPTRVTEDLGLGAWLASGDTVFVNLSQRRLDYPNDFVVVAHEVAHVYQYQMAGSGGACPGGYLPYGPLWMIEGSAEWLSWEMFHTSHFWRDHHLTAEDARANTVWITDRGLGSGIRLADLRQVRPIDVADGYGAYALAYVAVSRLVETAGLDALVDYHRDLGRGTCWVEAFSSAFGVDPAEFESDFAASR